MSRATISTIVAVLIFAGMSSKTQPQETQSTETQTSKPQESSGLKVLDRYVGTWRWEVVERQTNGEEKKSTATSIDKWSLQGQFLESRFIDSDGNEVALGLTTYDSGSGVYKAWVFSPGAPEPFPQTSQWNESEKTLSGESDLGNGMTMLFSTRFIAKDRYECTSTIKDASGNELGAFDMKAFRKE